jgi:hypothetical protein
VAECNFPDTLNDIGMRLQAENKIGADMAKILFSFERTIKENLSKEFNVKFFTKLLTGFKER